jgi:hypothetical protein
MSELPAKELSSSVYTEVYEKLFDTLLVLGYTRDYFRTYSAKDIKALIAAKLKSVREPGALQSLYKLETMITELRLLLRDAKEEVKSEE